MFLTNSIMINTANRKVAGHSSCSFTDCLWAPAHWCSMLMPCLQHPSLMWAPGYSTTNPSSCSQPRKAVEHGWTSASTRQKWKRVPGCGAAQLRPVREWTSRWQSLSLPLSFSIKSRDYYWAKWTLGNKRKCFTSYLRLKCNCIKI